MIRLRAASNVRVLGARLGRFGSERRGSVLILFGLLSFVLMLFVGLAVDVTFAVRFRSALQEAADSAALAGASVYGDDLHATAGQAAATQAMGDSIPRLPDNAGVDFSVTPIKRDRDDAPAAHDVRVVASGRIRTTFLAIMTDYMTVSVAAVGTNEIEPGTGPSEEVLRAPPWMPDQDIPPLYDSGRNLDLEVFGLGNRQIHLTR